MCTRLPLLVQKRSLQWMLGREGHSALASTSSARGGAQQHVGLHVGVAAVDLASTAPARLWHNCETGWLQAAEVREDYEVTPGGAPSLRCALPFADAIATICLQSASA